VSELIHIDPSLPDNTDSNLADETQTGLDLPGFEFLLDE
jgi:hypothetical protein